MPSRRNHSLNYSRRRFLHICGGTALGAFALPAFAQASATHLDVYKEVTCGCCANWVDRVQQQGFVATVHHPQDLNGLKAELGVLPQWQSCHTAVTANGFLFEGHVPARYITQFLAAPPDNTLGLAVPGMPMGSPGMEVGDQFSPYDVMLLKKDGSAEVFASIKSPADQ